MADLKTFLDKIAQIESNGGRNTNHPVIQSGMHRGMSAIGRYGLMPLTVQDIAAHSENPEIQKLTQYEPTDLKAIVEGNPGIEKELASALAEKVLNKQGGDPVKAAYAWNQGSNLNPSQINEDKLQSSPYVRKFLNLTQPNQEKASSITGSAPKFPTKTGTPMNPIELREEPFESDEGDDKLAALKKLMGGE